MSRFEFTSVRFIPYLPEDCQSNPGKYGFELADWLSRVLVKNGIATSYPMQEDWGWFIQYVEGDAEFMIGCGSQSNEGEGYEGKPIGWHIFVKQALTLKQRLRGQDEPKILARLTNTIANALQDEGISASVSEST